MISKNRDDRETNEAVSLEYIDLAPIDNIPNNSEYFHALDWALKNEKVRNIAISGPYGSGKSSIIETYLKNNKKIRKRSINISMATFESGLDNTASNNSNSDDVSMKMLEDGVLKQLFYKVDHAKIPQSRYRKLHKINLVNIVIYTFICIELSAFFTFLFAPDFILKIASKVEDVSDYFVIPFFAIFVLVCFIISVLIYGIFIKLLSNARIKEITLPADTKVDSREDPDSIFNKNLDEIMYFFEANRQYNVVFFEDFDRFNNSEIFIKLRELNTLLNNYDNLKKRGHIRFVYAVKDDIFKNEDRTKFFDFIIPVIPIMNSTNAGDILIDKLNVLDDKKDHDISQQFIFDVSPFISDMRILQNIYNEFILYRKTLRNGQDLNLKDEEMMSLIIFKNIYPKNFAELQAEKGIVKEAFDIIKQRKEEVIQEEQDIIADDERLLAAVDEELLKDKRELKIAMMSALVDWKGHMTQIEIRENYSTKTYTTSQMMNDFFDINTLIPNSNQTITIFYSQWNDRYYSNNNITVNKDVLNSYITRFNNLIKTVDGKKEEIQHRIESNRTKIREINNYSLKRLIEEYGAEKILPEKVLENKLLTFLLRRGYINEKYANYINHFKGVSLTKDDMNFILSVKYQQPLPPNYSLTKTDIIINHLQEFEFGLRAIYNYDLLERLLSSSKDKSKLDTFIIQLSKDEESWNFIDTFINITKHTEIFINLLACRWTDMWEVIYNDFSLGYDKKVFYLKLILAYATLDNISEQNSEDSISEFMLEHNDILQKLLDKSHSVILKSEKIKEVLKDLKIKFECLLIENIDSELIDFIFDNNYYAINDYMINEIVKYKNISLLSELRTKNYSTIRKLNYTHLLNNVNSNLKEYMDTVFFNDENTHEDIDSIIFLIKALMEDAEMLTRIIDHEDFCVADINDFCGDLPDDKKNYVNLIWNQLLKNNKINAEWKNVITYFNRFGFTTELKEYITANCDTLITSDENDVTNDLVEDLIKSDIDDFVFKKIIRIIHIQDFDIPFSSISNSKMKTLIELNCIQFTPSNYNSVFESHPDLKAEFIIMNQDEYIDKITEISMKSDLLIELLKNPRGKSEFKQKIVKTFAYDLMTNDLAQIIINNEYTIDKDIFFEVWRLLDNNHKDRLLLKYYELLDNDDLEKCFDTLSNLYPGFNNRSHRHEVEMSYSDFHVRLAEYLESKDYITSHCIRENKNKSSHPRKLFDSKIDNKSNRKIVCRIKAKT